jgi:hypothetical protein
MDLNLDPLALLLAAAVTAAIGVCLPDVLFLAGLTRIKRGTLAGPTDDRCRPGAIVTPDIAEQLAELDFAPAGVYWEQMPAHKRFHEAIFVSKTGDCFASVYRLFNNDDARVAFKTAFEDGAYVLTQNYTGGSDIMEKTLWTGGSEVATLETVVAEHRRRVRKFVAAGHHPLPAVSMDDHIEAEIIYMDHPTMRSDHYGTVRTLFGFKVGVLLGGPLLLYLFGVGTLGLAITMLLLACGMLLFRYYGAIVDRMLPAEEPG